MSSGDDVGAVGRGRTAVTGLDGIGTGVTPGNGDSARGAGRTVVGIAPCAFNPGTEAQTGQVCPARLTCR